jgi:hypothetical protein
MFQISKTKVLHMICLLKQSGISQVTQGGAQVIFEFLLHSSSFFFFFLSVVMPPADAVGMQPELAEKS